MSEPPGNVGAPRSRDSLVNAGDVRLGYCTNVHAGHDLDSTLANLKRHASTVRESLGLAGRLDIGLWLSAGAVDAAAGRVLELRQALRDSGLRAFSFNGFPYGDFHEPVVKHAVYEPNWADPRRVRYTLDLIAVLGGLLGEHDQGSISTVPVGWPGTPCAPVDPERAAMNLRYVADVLARTRQETGQLIHLDLEPEPGCILSTSDDVIAFWKRHLLVGGAGAEGPVREHLRVCHDVCHAAVMFEDQAQVLNTYSAAGIQVGKVQISSAPRIELAGGAQDRAAMHALESFAEARYLHQTCVRSGRSGQADPGAPDFHEDLPAALSALRGRSAPGEARVHFHVPIFMDSIGPLGTTQDHIEPAIRAALASGVNHFEVETYAWNVFPPALAGDVDLAAGIAREMRFAAGLINWLLR
ncbi:MAG: metabolite traffic protein EboE [Phycisphaerales bacterium]